MPKRNTDKTRKHDNTPKDQPWAIAPGGQCVRIERMTEDNYFMLREWFHGTEMRDKLFDAHVVNNLVLFGSKKIVGTLDGNKIRPL